MPEPKQGNYAHDWGIQWKIIEQFLNFYLEPCTVCFFVQHKGSNFATRVTWCNLEGLPQEYEALTTLIISKFQPQQIEVEAHPLAQEVQIEKHKHNLLTKNAFVCKANGRITCVSNGGWRSSLLVVKVLLIYEARTQTWTSDTNTWTQVMSKL